MNVQMPVEQRARTNVVMLTRRSSLSLKTIQTAATRNPGLSKRRRGERRRSTPSNRPICANLEKHRAVKSSVVKVHESRRTGVIWLIEHRYPLECVEITSTESMR